MRFGSNSNCRLVRRVGWGSGGVLALLALVCWISHVQDRTQLRMVANEQTGVFRDNASKVIALTQWVHGNHAARENKGYFFFRRLRATPMQVLHGGGDCADKSRLLCALLREIDIPCTMVLCFSRATRVPTHTVVEAQTTPNDYVVVDPAYNMFFPKNEPGQYHGLLELRADPQILDRRLAQLIPVLPPTAPVYCYKPELAAYDHASSINWERNALTKAAHAILYSSYSDEVYRIRRPNVLEEPKLFLAVVLLGAGFLSVVASRLVVRVSAVFASLPTQEVALCGR